ncbi:MAG: molecular chaperone TorD family protein [Eggerthellaceae bacterium]|nr:molecular chaperone TorD family protein [Eggerthellaceae bacterium]
MVAKSELIDFFEASADTYLFLSQVYFRELNDEAIEILAAEAPPEKSGYENIDEGYRLIKRYFRFSGGDRRTQLACEYARVFLASGVHSDEKRTAVPYESVFTSEEHIVMQDSRDDVMKIFARDGFKVDPSLHEPEDHLSFELEYLSEMNRRALEIAESESSMEDLYDNLQKQKDFMERHLLNWLPELYKAAENHARLAFYLGMLRVTMGFLEQSRDIIINICDQIEEGSADG